MNRLELDTALESIGLKGNHAVKLITESTLILAVRKSVGRYLRRYEYLDRMRKSAVKMLGFGKEIGAKFERHKYSY